MKYDWLLFDADNTILDFNEAQSYALREALTEIGVIFRPAHNQVYDKINRSCWRAYEEGKLSKALLRYKRFQLFFMEIGLKDDPEAFAESYLVHLSQSTAMMEGAMDLLQTLRSKYQLALVTNGIKEVQRSRLELSGLGDYFSYIAISDEIGVAKPDASFFRHVFQGLAHPSKERTLIIGDNLNADIRGGLDFGIHACWFNYDRRERYLEVAPTYEITHLTDLYSFL
ncbi:MAG: noncanonical pyrimidine nucleotidase, YjjG family [Saprospiraceae bacterium]|nr:noncanonical pyrimidine nucleotidase, YjjG family [Saprospiraceae bacterium]